MSQFRGSLHYKRLLIRVNINGYRSTCQYIFIKTSHLLSISALIPKFFFAFNGNDIIQALVGLLRGHIFNALNALLESWRNPIQYSLTVGYFGVRVHIQF